MRSTCTVHVRIVLFCLLALTLPAVGCKVAVNPTQVATTLVVSGLTSPATSGAAGSIVVVARTAQGQAAADYTGTVAFTSSDTGATLPANYTFTASDAGIHVFANAVTLATAGSQSVTVTDTGNNSLTDSGNVTVVAGTATAVEITGVTTALAAGGITGATITMRDAAGNVATGYTGVLGFTSTDSLASATDVTMLAADTGTKTIASYVTFNIGGTHTFTLTDKAQPGVTATSGGILVTPSVTTTALCADPLHQCDAVIVDGTGFDPTHTNNNVTFNGVAGTVQWSTNTQMALGVPDTTAGNVVVTVNGVVASGTLPFTFNASGITVLNQTTGGTPGFSNTQNAAISGDGDLIAFSTSQALDGADTNGVHDIYLRVQSTGVVTRLSLSTTGGDPDAASFDPVMSIDGRFVAFRSAATNLVSGDTNGKDDIFLLDRDTGHIRRVSVGQLGAQANGDSKNATISGDGRYVAYQSDATNLAPNDTNSTSDVFLYDALNHETIPVSVDQNGNFGLSFQPAEFPFISLDGSIVVFNSYTQLVPGDTNGTTDCYLFRVAARTNELVSLNSSGQQANGEAILASISADNRYVTFASTATNIVSGVTNGKRDIYIRDLMSGTTGKVSQAFGGGEVNDDCEQSLVSRGGRLVFWSTRATNVLPSSVALGVDCYVTDRQTGLTTAIAWPGGALPNGNSLFRSLSADDRWIAFGSSSSNMPSPGGASFQCYVVPTHINDCPVPQPTLPRLLRINPTSVRSGSEVELLGHGFDGTTPANNQVRFGAVPATVTSATGTRLTVVVPNGVSSGQVNVTIGANVTQSLDYSLAPVIVSRATDDTISNGASGALPFGWAFDISISANGRFVAFASDADNLVAGDGNGVRDVFVRDRDTDGDGVFDEPGAVSTVRVSVDTSGADSDGASLAPTLSASGRYVLFFSDATNLIASDTNGARDLFMRDMQTDTTTRINVDSSGLESVGPANGGTGLVAAITGDGRFVAFVSPANDLVTGDTNGAADVFVRDLLAGTTVRVSVDSAGAETGGGGVSGLGISDDGRFVCFDSNATDLVPGDTNVQADVFVHDRDTDG
ncbi:MAG: IPT/TIG domain-containing protein, partial [Planctomycetota bacterium]